MSERKTEMAISAVGELVYDSGPGKRRKGKRPKGQQRLGNVRWEGFDHRHMWNMIMDAHPGDVFGRHDQWGKIGTRLADVNKTVQTELNTLFQSWRGSAAITAALSNTRLLEWSQEAAETTQQVGEQLGRYGNALVEARMRMPQPKHVHYEQSFRRGDGAAVQEGPENAYTLLQVLDDKQYTLKQRAEAKERAVEVMRAFERDAVYVEGQLETYSTAPSAPGPEGSGDPVYVPGPGPGPGPGPSPSPSPAPLPLPGIPAPTESAGANPSLSGSGGGPGGGGLGSGGAGGLGGVGAGAGGIGAGSDSAYGGRNLAGGPLGRGPLGGGPLTGAGGPGASGASGGAGALGRGGAGALGGQAAAAEAAAARGAAGAAGTRGGGAFYPPMAGAGGREEDKEKRVAPYIVADDDLFDDDRPVAPPVFGA